MARDEFDRESHAWWEAKDYGKDPHEIMGPLIKRIMADQQVRYNNYEQLNVAYEYGLNATHWAWRADEQSVVIDNLLRFNYARRATKTLISKTVKSAVTPMPITTGADFFDRENAERLGYAIAGEFSKNKVNTNLLEDVVTDGYVLGNGFFYVPHGLDHLEIECLPCEDVVVDEVQGRYRRPQEMFFRREISRDVLLAKYGKQGDSFFGTIKERREGILSCPSTTLRPLETDALAMSSRNLIEVWVGFHKRSGPDEDDGRYCVMIQGLTLEFLPWNRDRIPLISFTPNKKRRHYHGLSMLQQILPAQKEHDKVSLRVQQSNDRLGGTHLITSRDAKIDTRELGGFQGTVIECDAPQGLDQAVKELNPAIANEQVLRYRQGLVDEMQQVQGISSMTMTGTPQEGLKDASGKALEVAEEQMAEGLILEQNSKDEVLLDLAWLIIEEAEAICEEHPDHEVTLYKNGNPLETVKWKEVIEAAGQYKMELQPAGDLAKTASAKFTQVMEMFNAKAITVDQFRKLWFVPDLKAENEIDLSDEEIILRVLNKIARDGKALLPESFDNFALILTLGRKFYNLARNKNLPEDKLSLIRDYIEEADRRNKEAIAANAPPPPAPANPPQATPPPAAPPGPMPQAA